MVRGIVEFVVENWHCSRGKVKIGSSNGIEIAVTQSDSIRQLKWHIVGVDYSFDSKVWLPLKCD